jgi:hemerythrin-like metal-binding protein
MSFFEWDASLDIGVDEMNRQHQILIGLMDVLHQKNTQGVSRQELLQSAQELVNYVIKHFKDEENYMETICFPNLETHKKLHENLLTDLARFVEEFKKSTDAKISGEFTIFLKFWLSTHIRGVDTKYGVYAKQLSS